MRYYAKVVALNEDVEEEVCLCFGEWNIYCFINEFPDDIRVGSIHLVDVDIVSFDGLNTERSIKKEFSLQREGNTFSYAITGLIVEGYFIFSNMVFDNDIVNDYLYLEGEYVTIYPDRITVSFI